MNDELPYENISRKSKAIDDDGPISKKKQKKHMKNQNKTLSNQKLIQSLSENANQNKTSHKANEESQRKLSKQKKLFQTIKGILPNHSSDTIWRVLEKNNFSQHQALEELMEIPEEKETDLMMQEFDSKIPNKPPDKKKQSSPQKAGEQLMEEIINNGIDFDKTEFEELFEEITTIIKKDQEEKGVTLIEINEFVDDCNSIKKLLFTENEDIYLDENDPLVVQSQIFLQQIIKGKVAEEKRRQNQFPTIGSVSHNQGQNFFEKIQEGYKEDKKKQEFFVPSKIPAQFQKMEKSKKNNIFSVNSIEDGQSYQDIQQLNKEFQGLGIDRLKFLYSRLPDYNLCRQFLDHYYKDQKVNPKFQQTKTTKRVRKPVEKGLQYEVKLSDKIDPSYRNYSLEQIREQLDHLYKRRQLFRMTRGKTTNHSYRKELDRLASCQDPRIQKLSEIARYKLIEEMSETHPQYLDLHGYREEEIDGMLYEVEKMIVREFKKGNSKIQTRKVGPNVYCIVNMVTGKGLHSKYGKSILKPAIQGWCSEREIKCVTNEDSVDIYIQL